MARIDLADAEDLPAADRALIETLSTTEGLPEAYHHLIEDPERNVYRAIARRPAILEPFRALGSAAWEHCGLSPRERELAILAVAAAFEADYEFHQHVRIALREGLEPAEIRAVVAGDPDPFSADEEVLLAFVRAYVEGAVDDALFAAFVDAYDEPTAVGVGLLSGLYVTVALFGDALALEPEEPFVGWDLARL